MKLISILTVFAGVYTLSAFALPTLLQRHIDSDLDLSIRADLDGDYNAYVAARDVEDSTSIERRRRRGGGGKGGALGTAANIASLILEQSEADKANRKKFQEHLLNEESKARPKMNYVVCHVGHRVKFDGVKGKDWFQRKETFGAKIGSKIDYEVYSLKTGEFWREGDGGFTNWMFMGNIKTRDQDGKHLVFGPP